MAPESAALGTRARKRARLTEAGPADMGPARFIKVSPSTPPVRRPVLLNRAPATQVESPSEPDAFRLITSLCSDMNVLLHVVRYMTPRSLVYLYSISAPFHYMMNSHFTAFVLSSARGFSAQAEWYFPWRCYRELCIDDPGLRRSRTRHNKGAFVDRLTGERRASDECDDQTGASKSCTSAHIMAVPSLRWLKMVTYREIVAQEIVAWLAVGGHRMPVKSTIDALKRMWFLMDIPINSARIALIHNTTYFSNAALGVLNMLFLKMDMYWTDPVTFTGGEVVLREFLLAERSLTTLWNYLRGADGRNRLDLLKLWVKHGYQRPARPGPETEEQQRINDARAAKAVMGIPARLVGRWGYEIYGVGHQKLLRPDELVLREQIRRNLDLQKHWLRMIRWGFLNNNLETMPPVKAEEVVYSLVQRRRNERERARLEAAEKGPEDGKIESVKQDAVAADVMSSG